MEQRNIYRGYPARAWITLQLQSRSGESQLLDLLVDTGSPCSIIVEETIMAKMRWHDSTRSSSNFGLLSGGWLHITIPQIGFDEKVLGYSNDSVVQVVQRTDLNFSGLIGLPLLRMLRYGGDEGTFWIRRHGRS